jgi:hypothetical protein
MEEEDVSMGNCDSVRLQARRCFDILIFSKDMRQIERSDLMEFSNY